MVLRLNRYPVGSYGHCRKLDLVASVCLFLLDDDRVRRGAHLRAEIAEAGPARGRDPLVA